MDKRSWLRKGLVGLVTGFFNGMFGSGGGMVAVFALEKYLAVDTQRAHATALAIMLPLSAVSLVVYVLQAAVPWEPLPFVAPALVLGSFFGAKLLPRINPLWLNRIFSGLMLAAAVRLLFWK